LDHKLPKYVITTVIVQLRARRADSLSRANVSRSR